MASRDAPLSVSPFHRADHLDAPPIRIAMTPRRAAGGSGMGMGPRVASLVATNHERFVALALSIFLLAGPLLVGCGGSKGGPASTPDDSAEGTSEDEGWSPDEPETASAPQANCDDGSCFECGDGVCPTGFFCDADAAAGPACSWLPECAKTPGCSCLEKTLGSSCSCEERDGGPHVTCS